MPLYEAIVIAKCNSAMKTAGLFKAVSNAILNSGGNVRDVNVLGDRVLSARARTRDHEYHSIGRYTQILFDGSPKVARIAELAALENFETMRVQIFKLKDFFSEAQYYQKAYNRTHTFMSEDLRNRGFIENLKKMKNTPDHEGGLLIDKLKYK